MKTTDYLDGATVLIVDDADNRSVLGGWFVDAGASVLAADSETSVLEMIKRRPDLVVVNVELSEPLGGAVTRSIKSDPLTAEILVIERSAAPVDDDAVVESLHHGADAYLPDPLSKRVLIATADALLRTQDLSRCLEVALSSGNSGVFDWSIPTGRLRWSESLEHLHGMQPGEFGGTIDDFKESVHPADRERVGVEVDTALEASDHFTIAFRFLRTDETTGHMEGQGRIFRNSRGEPMRMLGLAQDVSNRVESRTQLEQLRRLASRLSGVRTSAGVLGALDRELNASNASVTLSSADDPTGDNVVYSFSAGAHRLDLTWCERRGGITRRQAIALGELGGSAIDRALRFEAERTNAQILQAALQPTSTPVIEGFRLDAAYVSADERDRLGGDFYDVLEIDDAFVVVVGDVAGHGLEATRLMGSIRAMLRTIAASWHVDPVEITERGRALFHDVCGADSPFATVVVCRIEKATGRATVVSAGHPPPLCGTAAGEASLVDVAPVPPLGIESSVDVEATEIVLEVGEWLAFYTDGVFERRDVPIEEAVRTAANSITGAPHAQDLLTAGETGSEGTSDDRVVVVVERLAAVSDVEDA